MYKISLFILLPTIGMAVTRHVYETDGAQGIQSAIDASNPYDTVMVHSGTYYVRDIGILGITMKDKIILLSPSPDSVTLSGANSTGTDTAYHVIYCDFGNASSRDAVIKGFTIRDGRAKESSGRSAGGGGILCYRSSPTIINNVITHNSSTKMGGGILCFQNSSIIRENTITFNSSGFGGGIGCSRDNTIIENNTFTSNSAGYDGGAIYCEDYGSSLISNNIITSNNANYGGGIYCFFSYAKIINNTITYNSAINCAGGIECASGSATVEKNVIAFNTANRYGGGILCYHGSHAIINNTITSNKVNEHGGGIFCWKETSEITDNIIISNKANKYGGGIYCYRSATKVTDNVITLNLADSSGGGILCHYGLSKVIGNTITFNSADLGGSIFCEADTSTITHNTIIDTVHSAIYITVLSTSSIKKNNIYATQYSIYNNTSNNINATSNYWYTIDTSIINTKIWDKYDDFSKGLVSYTPYLTLGDTIAPVPAPLNLTGNVSTNTIYLNWERVPVADLSGYKVWYDTDTSGFPYEGVDANEGNSPIDVGNVTSFELTGLGGETYYIAVTAYDNNGNNSWYSNEIDLLVGVEEDIKSLERITELEISPNMTFVDVRIKYRLSDPCNVKLAIYNLLGQEIITLINTKKLPGNYVIKWSCKNNQGKRIKSGIYFCRLETDNDVITKKIFIW